MEVIHVSLFGQFHAWTKGGRVNGLNLRKTQELFSYLLIHRGVAHPREFLGELLWEDSPPVQARKYLRQALWHLQSSISGSSDGPALAADAATIELLPGEHIQSDAAEFEQAYQLSNGIAPPDLPPETVRKLEHVLSLYKGEFMDGFYTEWCLCERERLHRMQVNILDRLLVRSESRREFASGVEYGARILQDDPACERTHRRLMRLHYLAGDRTAALRQFETCACRLQEELGVHPSQRTLQLRDQIRADQPRASDVNRAQKSVSEDETDGAAIRPLLSALTKAVNALSELQKEIGQDIAIFDRLLRRGSAAESLPSPSPSPKDGPTDALKDA